MSAGTVPQGQGSTAAYKVIAVVVWGIGTYATYEFIGALVGAADWVPWAAIVVQAGLTFLESPIWRGRGGFVQYAGLGLDVFTNVGGLYVMMTNLDSTQSYKALVSAASISGEINPMVALLLSIVAGTLLAAAPEALWRQR